MCLRPLYYCYYPGFFKSSIKKFKSLRPTSDSIDGKKLSVVRLLNWNSLIEVALEWIANRTQLMMVNCDGWSTAEYGNLNELDIKVQRSGRILVMMLSFCHVSILRKRSYQTHLQVINTYWIFVIFCVNSSRRHITLYFPIIFV